MVGRIMRKALLVAAGAAVVVPDAWNGYFTDLNTCCIRIGICMRFHISIYG